MNVVLIGNYPGDRQQSMTRYAACLHRELTRRGHSVRLVTPTVRLRSLLPSRYRIGKWLGYIDKYILFRIGFSRSLRDADLVHICDHSNAPYLPWIKGRPSIITVHDAFGIRSAMGHYPQNRTGASGRKLQQWILHSLAYADRLIYVSDKTKEDFSQVLSITTPSDVVLHALNWAYRPASEEQLLQTLTPLGLSERKYLLHVGGNQWYKNRLGVLQAFARIQAEERFQDWKLVMAGKPMTEAMQAFIRKHSLAGVVSVEDVTNEDLQALYTGAAALLFPSLEEGFGWPLLEAQACACPVITSNREPMMQVAGAGAVYLDPAEPIAAVSALDEVMARREELVAAGLENLKRFSVEEMIDRYEAAYHRLLEATAAPIS